MIVSREDLGPRATLRPTEPKRMICGRIGKAAFGGAETGFPVNLMN